jgi:hypothetical protein
MTNNYLDKFLKRRNIYYTASDAMHGGAMHGGAPPDEGTSPESTENIIPTGVKEEIPKKSVISKITNAPGKLVSGIARSTKQVFKSAKNMVMWTTEEKIKINKLSQKMSDSIQKAFSMIKLKEKLREIDLQKLSKLVIEKPINLNFGGGLLIFGPDLKISSMIHIYNKNNEPCYFEKQFTSTIEKNTINDGIKSDEKYDIQKIIQSIRQMDNSIKQ